MNEEKTISNDEKVAAFQQNSVVANSPKFSRTGLDANGLTEEFDRNCADLNRAALASMDGDAIMQEMYLNKMMDGQIAMHNATAQYEANEMYKGALESVKSREKDLTMSLGEVLQMQAAADESEIEAELKKIKTKVSLTTDQEDEYRTSIRKDRKDLFSERVNTVVNEKIRTMHSEAMNDFVRLGYTPEEAYEAASKMASDSFKSIVAGLDAGKYSEYADYLIADKERDNATKGPQAVDENGEPVFEERDGKKVAVYTTDFGGLAWCTSEDISGLRSAHTRAMERAARDAANKMKMSEDADLAAVGKAYNEGLSVLSCASSSYDPDALNNQIAKLNMIVSSSTNPKVIDHANSLIGQLQSRADRMTKRASLWRTQDSKLRTYRDYLRLLADLDAQGNVASLVVTTGIKIDANGNPVLDANGKPVDFDESPLVDICQRKIAVVQNGLERGIIPEPEGQKLLKEYTDNFCRTNWGETAKFLYGNTCNTGGGVLSVDIDASWQAFKKGNDEDKVAAYIARFGGDEGRAANYFGTARWADGKLENAKNLMYKYVKDGKTIILTGEDVQKISDAVLQFQMRNANPTPEDVDAMLTTVFDTIMTDRITFGKKKTEVYMGDWGEAADEYVRGYYEGTGPMTKRISAPVVKRVTSDFDAFLRNTRGGDYSKNFSR